MEWIKIEDRIPAREDANADEFVWGFPTCDGDVGVFHYANVGDSGCKATYWAKMVVPEPPQE